MKTPISLIAVTAAAWLSACATGPTTPPELQQARDAVHDAESNPAVAKYAPLEMKRANDSLIQANDLSAKGKPVGEVASASTVAATEARTALALANARASEAQIKAADAERERARAEANARAAQRAKAQASDASAQAAVAQADAAQAKQQAAALQQQLVDLQAHETDRGTLVTLGDMLFEFGKADIMPGAYDSIRKLADYLKQHPDKQVRIEGFTDSVGSDAANLQLSQLRADAVANALQDMGVDATRIVTRGYGKQYPVASNATDSDRALNRRVEVYISDNGQPVRGRG
jgi:outer membrane protein OmpA-like peptidoglycan-associated protein